MRKKLMLMILSVAASVPFFAQTSVPKPNETNAMVAVIYYWKAKPGKLEEYSRYIQDVAEPIDRDAQKHGAFISITTYVSENPNSPWTHMRVFTVADRAHAEALKSELDAATARIVPDEAKRKANSDYAATLRDAVSSEQVLVLSSPSPK